MRLRIRPTLMAATAFLVVATTAAVAVAINSLGSRIVEDLVDRRFQTIAESAAAEVANLVDTATGVLREQSALAAQGLLPLGDSAALGRRFACPPGRRRATPFVAVHPPGREEPSPCVFAICCSRWCSRSLD